MWGNDELINLRFEEFNFADIYIFINLILIGRFYEQEMNMFSTCQLRKYF